MKERKDVYKLPAGDTTLDWYAKAVIKMKSLPSTDPRSWNYQAAMHGFRASNPFWAGSAPIPSQSDQNKFWNQCQHGSWFFLPWHRMYLAYFEQIVAQTIVDLGGPADWALPFWNYSDTTNPDALKIPPAFTTPSNSGNALWMPGRRNTLNGDYVGLEPLDTIPYTGDGITSPLGFGGPETGFSHGGSIHGDLEGNIHDNVHVMIGGAMGNPNTAGLDPIFWLHHANIDRLWQVWINKGGRVNPTKSSWLNFTFVFHDKDRNVVSMNCKGVEDTQTVLSGYTYEGVPATTQTLESMDTAGLKDFSLPLEVVAASNTQLNLGGRKNVQLEMVPSGKAASVNEGGLEGFSAPKTTILHLENITGKGVPPIHNVYINMPEAASNKKAYYAGAVSFFGVEMASTPSAHEAGSGQHYAINITKLLNTLRAQPGWNEQQLNIQFEPIEEMDADTNVSIGRISLYSE
jgi:tyrosinase